MAFGARCEVFNESNNGMFVNSLGTESGTMRFVMLDTWRLATSDRYEELPVDDAFIRTMNTKAAGGKAMPCHASWR